MMTLDDLKKQWEKIPEYTVGYLQLAINHPLKFQIGRNLNNTKSLIILCSDQIKQIPSSSEIQAMSMKFKNGQWILEFRLLNSKSDELFLQLCWDLIKCSNYGKNPLQIVILRYKKWQKLLQFRRKKQLSFIEQKGLLGELLYMEFLLDEMDIAPEVILDAWMGPEGNNQDYIFDTTWAEIKTITMEADSVRISSLEQLDCDKDGTLEILILEEEGPGTKQISLISEVKLLRLKFIKNPVLLDQFNVKLTKCGYIDDDEEEYGKHQFRFIAHNTYLVNSDFPKLIKRNVPLGITNCEYAISLVAMDKFKRR